MEEYLNLNTRKKGTDLHLHHSFPFRAPPYGQNREILRQNPESSSRVPPEFPSRVLRTRSRRFSQLLDAP